MIGDNKTRFGLPTWGVAGIFMLAGVVASLAVPAVAQDGTGPAPQNAQDRRYGGGWECDLGYRVDDGGCLEITIPENAYPTGRSYGTGWACRRGYEEVSSTSCEPIRVPDNAFLRSSGYGWQCERGFRQERNACAAIDLPNAREGGENRSRYGRSFPRSLMSFTPARASLAIL
jgi:hypothetical protein